MDFAATNTDLVRNIVDVLLVAFVIYRGLLVIRGTRAVPMLAGLGVVVGLYLLAVKLGFVTLGWLLSNFLSSLILVVVVLFQDEIRRGLTKVGSQPLFGKPRAHLGTSAIDDVVAVCERLAENRIGALIVLQREVGLGSILEQGTRITAALHPKLLYSLFVKDSELHDGAVVLVGERIVAAGCVLPLSERTDLNPRLGTRHRAALGITEQSDAVALVVSEQTGGISVAREGRLSQNINPTLLRDLLVRLMQDGARIEESIGGVAV